MHSAETTDNTEVAKTPIVLFMPAYNEEESVAACIARAPKSVNGHPVKVLVIDDGSTDGTVAEAVSAGSGVVKLGTNHGLGAAVRRGFAEALSHDPAAIAFCDADGEYPPEELEALVQPILDDEADYVIGSRFIGDIEHMHPHRKVGNLTLTRLLSLIARRRITDGQSGYRAFSPQAAKAAEIIHDYNYAQVLTLDLLAKGFRYHEVPISYHFRTAGDSFIKLGTYLRKVTPAVYREVKSSQCIANGVRHPYYGRHDQGIKGIQQQKTHGHRLVYRPGSAGRLWQQRRRCRGPQRE